MFICKTRRHRECKVADKCSEGVGGANFTFMPVRRGRRSGRVRVRAGEVTRVGVPLSWKASRRTLNPTPLPPKSLHRILELITPASETQARALHNTGTLFLYSYYSDRLPPSSASGPSCFVRGTGMLRLAFAALFGGYKDHILQTVR